MKVQIKPFRGKQLSISCHLLFINTRHWKIYPFGIIYIGHWGNASSRERGLASESHLLIASFLFSLTLQFPCNHSCITE